MGIHWNSPSFPTWDSGRGWTIGYEWCIVVKGMHWTFQPILHSKVDWIPEAL